MWFELLKTCLPHLIDSIVLIIVAVLTYFSGKHKGQNEVLRQIVNISQKNVQAQQSSASGNTTNIFQVTPQQAQQILDNSQKKGEQKEIKKGEQ